MRKVSYRVQRGMLVVPTAREEHSQGKPARSLSSQARWWKQHWIRRTAIAFALILLLYSLSLLLDLHSEFFPRTLRVDPGVVGEMRSIGKVLAEAEEEATWDGETRVAEILVIDVGSSSTEESINKAVSILRLRDWVVNYQNHDSLSMASSKWGNVDLWIKGIEFFKPNPNGAFRSRVKKIIDNVQERHNSEALIVLSLDPNGI